MVEKIYKRKITEEIIKYLPSKEIIVIYGSRQVGKTSLLKYLIENYIKKNVFYFDLELQNLLDLCNQGAESVFKYLIQKGADEKNKIFLIIDEIQYMDNPTKFLKIMHDHFPDVKLIVSGSALPFWFANVASTIAFSFGYFGDADTKLVIPNSPDTKKGTCKLTLLPVKVQFQ